MNCRASIVLCVLSLAGTAAAQPPVASSDAINRSIQETLDFIDGPWVRGGFQIRYTRSDGTATEEVDVAWLDGRIRVSTTPAQADQPFLDVAIGPDASWKLSSGTFFVFDVRQPNPPGHDNDSFCRQMQSEAERLLFGSIQGLRGKNLAWRPVDNTRWQARVNWRNREAEGVSLYTIRVFEPDFVAVVEQVVHDRHEGGFSPPFPRTQSRHESWRLDPVMARPVAGQWTNNAVRLQDRAAVEKRLSLVSIEPVTEATMIALTRLPSAEQPDVIRGPLGSQNVIDYRGEPTATIRGPDGMTRSMPLADLPEPRGVRVIRVAGWAALACIIVLVLVLRWRGAKA